MNGPPAPPPPPPPLPPQSPPRRSRLPLVLAIAAVGLFFLLGLTGFILWFASARNSNPVLNAGDGTLSPAAGFQITAPIAFGPEKIVQIPAGFGHADMHEFLATANDGTVYLMTFVDYSPLLSIKVEDAVRGMTGDGTLKSDTQITIAGHSAHELVLSRPKDGMNINLQVRALVVGHRLYQMSVSVADKPINQPSANAYFSSFKLLSH